MKRILITACVLLALSACKPSPYDADGSSSSTPPPDHSHAVFQGNNVVEHDPVGYCGNTVTTVRCEKLGKQEERWEKSFWGGASVELTDFLKWLNYDDGICRCLPEYYVKTELSASEYGINLSEGYVRFEGKQIQLTDEQLKYLQETIHEIAADQVDGICSLPLAE